MTTPLPDEGSHAPAHRGRVITHLAARDEVELRDGRRLAFSTFGSRSGRPVVYLHGAIGPPMAHDPGLEQLIRDLSLRWLVVDRPGFGGSDSNPGATVSDLATDLEDLADHLGLDRFSLIGVSAGGPYALAAACALGERISSVAAVSSLPPPPGPHAISGTMLHYRLPLAAIVRAPKTAHRLADFLLGVVRRHPKLIERAIVAGAAGGDNAALMSDEARKAAVKRFLLTMERGPAATLNDYLVCTRPWGVDPGGLSGRACVWHGELDRLVPVAHAQRLAGELGNCSLSVAPGGGHFFFRDCLPEILSSLVEGEREHGLHLLRAA